jgi:hypothetical protein
MSEMIGQATKYVHPYMKYPFKPEEVESLGNGRKIADEIPMSNVAYVGRAESSNSKPEVMKHLI